MKRRDIINIVFFDMQQALDFINFFNEKVFDLDFVNSKYKLTEDIILSEDIIYMKIDDELFLTYEKDSQISEIIRDFVIKYPGYNLKADYTYLFEFHVDSFRIKYKYTGNSRRLFIKSLFGKDKDFYKCNLCGEYFHQPEDMLRQYMYNKSLICPYCGKKIKYDVFFDKYEMRLQ